jgi:hypothetical protein
MRQTSRCYNCGLPDHQTQVCPRYGPRYPEPGKTALDYAAKAQEIMNLVAADIVKEHNAEHQEDGEDEGIQADERERRNARARAARARAAAERAEQGEGAPGDQELRQGGGMEQG